MLTQILQKTPVWVWALLAGLIALGYSQTRDRVVSQLRAMLMPMAMVALSVYGTVSAFGVSPAVLGLWLVTAALLASWIMQRPVPVNTRFDGAAKQYAIPGSWLPMIVILAIFLTKYAVGVSLAMRPSLAHDDVFPLVIGALYGVFSGFFAGRTVRLWRLALA